MLYPVTITSQGQITIPAAVRRKVFKKTRKAVMKIKDDAVVLEPVSDILSLSGSLHKYAIKNKSIQEIVAMEKQAVEDAIVEEYKKELKEMRISLPKQK